MDDLATEWLVYATGLCGCGTGRDFALLLEVLRWCAAPGPKDGEGTYRSAAWELAAKVLDRADLIEHGAGIGWPWAAPRGTRLLALIDAATPVPDDHDGAMRMLDPDIDGGGR